MKKIKCLLCTLYMGLIIVLILSSLSVPLLFTQEKDDWIGKNVIFLPSSGYEEKGSPRKPYPGFTKKPYKNSKGLKYKKVVYKKAKIVDKMDTDKSCIFYKLVLEDTGKEIWYKKNIYHVGKQLNNTIFIDELGKVTSLKSGTTVYLKKKEMPYVIRKQIFNLEKAFIEKGKIGNTAFALYLDIKLKNGVKFTIKENSFEEILGRLYFSNPMKKYPKWSKKVWGAIKECKILENMTKNQVILSWGLPNDINRTVVKGFTSEQWVYTDDNYHSTYLYFKNGRLTGWQD